jgi:hypothetical protein
MTEFVGRTGSNRVYSYPETGGRGAATSALARNFASGPPPSDSPIPITTTGDQIVWDFIQSGAPSGIDVPITPHVTGQLLVTVSTTVENSSDAPADLKVQLQVDAGAGPVTVTPPADPQDAHTTVEANGSVMVSFTALLPGPPPAFTVGTPIKIEVLLTASADNSLVMVAESSTIEIQEVLPATG